MIFINEEIMITNKMELNEFISLLNGEAYNEDTEKIIKCIQDYLYEVWDRDEKLTLMIHKKISNDFYPIEVVNISETSDLSSTHINLFCKEKERSVSKKDEKAFYEFCEKYFKSLKPLFNRFCELDID